MVLGTAARMPSMRSMHSTAQHCTVVSHQTGTGQRVPPRNAIPPPYPRPLPCAVRVHPDAPAAVQRGGGHVTPCGRPLLHLPLPGCRHHLPGTPVPALLAGVVVDRSTPACHALASFSAVAGIAFPAQSATWPATPLPLPHHAQAAITCITPEGQRVQGSNTKPLTTPSRT